MTNGDKLRALSNEELAEFIGCYSCPPGTEDKCSWFDCTTCWANWLNAEEEEDDKQREAQVSIK